MEHGGDLAQGLLLESAENTEQVKNAAGGFTETIDPLSAGQLQVTYHMALAHLVYSPEQYPDLYKLVSQAYAISQEGFAGNRAQQNLVCLASTTGL